MPLEPLPMFVIFTVFGALNIPIGTFVNASDAMFGWSCGFGAAMQTPMKLVNGFVSMSSA